MDIRELIKLWFLENYSNNIILVPYTPLTEIIICGFHHGNIWWKNDECIIELCRDESVQKLTNIADPKFFEKLKLIVDDILAIRLEWLREEEHAIWDR